MTKTTKIIHHPYRPPVEFEGMQPPLYRASTVIFPNVKEMESRSWLDKTGYTYGLHGTPATFILEERLAEYEGGKHLILVPSGLSALAHVHLAVLKQGDQVLIPSNAYNPHQNLIKDFLPKWGVEGKFYDPLDINSIIDQLNPKTRLLWIEAPGSMTMEFPDIIEIIKLCRQHQILVAIDHTWSAGIAFNPFYIPHKPENSGEIHILSVDIAIHALTKFPSGGGDLLLGSISVQDDKLAMQVKTTHMQLGTGVSFHDVDLVLRSLPTMEIRYKKQYESAFYLANWLEGQRGISQILFPPLPGAPGHENWLKVCGESKLGAGIFSCIFDSKYLYAEVVDFVESLALFKLGYSWGGPLSLVTIKRLDFIRDKVPSWLKPGVLVRFCIGLEDVKDLQADLLQALKSLPLK
ncbi:MAG: aminotransferase class I/II-fold pyridoxal phosphate-dependent enzyme [Gammaproteobacteria bacterium]|nr:aminotransferase class I/II-fold pyridoxal phosphate-dependent enzyme [Gammaproteobacteria bacterium]